MARRKGEKDPRTGETDAERIRRENAERLRDPRTPVDPPANPPQDT